MTQRDLNLAVARATGESIFTVAGWGFVPLTVGPVEREPMVLKRDEVNAPRHRRPPNHDRRRTAAA